MTTPAGGVTLPELLPCPCGHQVDPDECPYPVPVGCEEWHQIGCIDGNCMWFVVAPTADEAINAWNTRAALAGEWRDVRETMPEWGRQVLVWGHDGIDLASHDGRGVWMDNAGRFLDEITHWHDSPAPPPAAPLPNEPA